MPKCLHCGERVQNPNGTTPKIMNSTFGDKVMECPHCKKKNLVIYRDAGRTLVFLRRYRPR